MSDSIDDLADRIRPQFPMLARSLDGQPLAFLDSASTTPKPRVVIDAVVDYYERCTANVHRGVHALGHEATQLYDAARIEAAGLVGAGPDEIVFLRGTTEAINFVAHGLGLGPEDEVIFPAGEHHANWLPWRVNTKPVKQRECRFDSIRIARNYTFHAHTKTKRRTLDLLPFGLSHR